jgi:4-amino-4-deoxy-L-arabinose transferase-like glycosyltransferase
MLAWGAARHSPAFCEIAHLSAGMSHWQLCDFSLYRVNPPLVRMAAALPVLFVGAKTDWQGIDDSPGSRSEFNVGEAFVVLNGRRSVWLYFLARLICIPFTILGGCACLLWATELYGKLAGIVALSLWCICPEIIAHGQMITSDAAAAALGVAAHYCFWRWLRRPGWSEVLTAGLVLGVTELTKSTWIILFGLWPVMWGICRFSAGSNSQSVNKWFVQGIQMILILAVGIWILNLGYGFSGTGRKLGSYTFVSRTLSGNAESGVSGNRFTNTVLGQVSIPLPSDYVRGLDEQKRDFESCGWVSYLRGQTQDRGWWYYYFYGLIIKLPLGIWLLFVLACIFPLRRHGQLKSNSAFVVLMPALVLLALVSSQTGFSIHFRYVLPILPFIFIWSSSVIPVLIAKGRCARSVIAFSLVWAIESSLAVYPHCLSYFNELASGPRGGAFHMVYSAHDWGQDLLYLKQWLDNNPQAQPLRLASFTYFDPQFAGITSRRPCQASEIKSSNIESNPLEPGWYAISTTLLWGIPWRCQSEAYSYFRRLKPVATAGYSICIYHLSTKDVDRIWETMAVTDAKDEINPSEK